MAKDRYQETNFKSASSEESDSAELKPADEFSLETTTPEAKKVRNSLMSTELASTLDRSKTSDRNDHASYIIAANSQSLGHGIKDFSMNKSLIRRDRQKKEQRNRRQNQL